MREACTTGLAPTGSRPKLPSVRARLRDATAQAHERIHAHAGFGAAAAGVIDVCEYRRLLGRLYGFHRPFDDLVRSSASKSTIDLDVDARARSPALRADLIALGLDEGTIVSLPLWSSTLPLASKGSLLGALYVVEGSTLGGLQIARALKGYIGDELGAGRSFFLGRGEQRSAMWSAFLKQLETLAEAAEQARDAINSAAATFATFEAWMADWKTGIATAAWA